MASPRTLVREQHGFSLIELLVVILIVGILAAVATPLYLGYVKDAKATEAKGIIGAVWTGLQGCAQAAAGTDCTVKSQFARAGLSTTGDSPDSRWKASAADTNVLKMDAATNTYQATPDAADGELIKLDGVSGKDTAGITVKYFWANSKLVGSFKCNTGSGEGAC